MYRIKIKYIQPFILLFSSTLLGITNKFIAPSRDRFYHQVCWLASHNTYATRGDYLVYYNQSLSLQDQLAYGARAFEFDTYYRCIGSQQPSPGPQKGGMRPAQATQNSNCTVSICHGDCNGINRAIYKPYTQAFGTQALDFAKDILPLFKKFLQENPNEIITFTLENYVDTAHGALQDFLITASRPLE